MTMPQPMTRTEVEMLFSRHVMDNVRHEALLRHDASLREALAQAEQRVKDYRDDRDRTYAAIMETQRQLEASQAQVTRLREVAVECRRYFHERPGNWERQLLELLNAALAPEAGKE